MLTTLIGYLAGAWLTLQLPALPDWHLLLAALPLALYALGGGVAGGGVSGGGVSRGSVSRGRALLCGAVLGACFTLAASEALLAQWVGKAEEGALQIVQGRISGLPRIQGDITRFQFVPLPGEEVQGLLRVAWYEPPDDLAPGQVWRLGLHVNRPSGQLNFGLFDYEKWLFSEGIAGRGYVAAQPRELLRVEPALFDGLRDKLRRRVSAHLGASPAAGVIIALMVGDTSGIAPSSWRTFSFTGVIHLLIISGLHIGIIGFLAWQLCRWLGLLLWPAALVTLLVSWVYAQLAGWGLPVQRAFIMVASVLLVRVLARQAVPAMHLCWAAAFVLILQPLTLLSRGAWLSFGAVAMLMAFVNERYTLKPSAPAVITPPLRAPAVITPPLRAPAAITPPLRAPAVITPPLRGSQKKALFAFFWWGEAPINLPLWRARLRTLLRAQWVVFIGMAPFLLTLTGYLAGGAFFVNLIAIPLVGFLLVPAVLATAVVTLISESLSRTLLTILDTVVGQLLILLDWLAALSPLVYLPTGDDWLTAAVRYGLLLAGCIILLMPRGLLPRWLGLLCCCCLFQGERPAEGLQMTFFDVGQGLSVMIEVEGDLLIYDTGPSYGEGQSVARQVVLPSIKAKGYRIINHLIISHGDNDHAGGLADLQQEMVIGRVVGSVADGVAHGAPCTGAWQKGAASFRLINADQFTGNDSSCLLEIVLGEARVLLTGDIGVRAEYLLLESLPPDVTVISVPHHGSDTSSSPALLNHVFPQLAVATTGYRNRFGHPSATVRDRYLTRGIKFLNTAEEGAIKITFKGNRINITTAREALPAIWRR
ncbi:MAG: ComEC/Rec2 family competence protein [Pseudomonadales bacterium]